MALKAPMQQDEELATEAKDRTSKPSGRPQEAIVKWVVLFVVIGILSISGVIFLHPWYAAHRKEHTAHREAESESVPVIVDAAQAHWKLRSQRIEDKPQGDTRSYDLATMENGLQVLSIQDVNSRSVSFAVAVEAGSLDDPDAFPGLMHFCEHMLFLGTKKYPEPDGFERFVSLNGGGQNAYTAAEVTVYYVQISQAAFVEAMDRFSAFFKDPLFNDSFVEKEVHAINSEHHKNIQDPSWRVIEVLRSLANPASATSRFRTGSLETLLTLPKQRGANPVDALKEQFKKLYCPPKMRLVTFGPKSGAEQLKAVTETFGKIPAGDPDCTGKPRRSFAEPAAWPKEQLQKWIDIRGVTEHETLWCIFSLPDLRKDYASQPLDYIVWVLGYEGENSLFQILRDELALAHSISASLEGDTSGMQLMLSLGLSDAGKHNPELVLDVIFAYIAVLQRQGVNEDLRKSLATANEISWNWAEPVGPSDTAQTIVERMTRLPGKDLLWGDSLTRHPDNALVSSLMKRLVPTNMNVALVHPNTGKVKVLDGNAPGIEIKKLPHYGVQHTIRDVETVLPHASDRWNKWLDGSSSGITDIASMLRERLVQGGLNIHDAASAEGETLGAVFLPDPPHPIKGLPTDINLSLAHAHGGDQKVLDQKLFGVEPTRLPAKNAAAALAIAELAGGDVSGTAADHGVAIENHEIWYRSGWTSNAPKYSPRVSVKVVFKPVGPADEPEHSPLEEMRMSLYNSLLGEEMSPLMQPTEAAGGSYGLAIGMGGLEMSFGGVAPVLESTAAKVIQEFRNHAAVRSAAGRFERVATLARKNLVSYTDMPIQYAIGDRNLLLTKGAHSRQELLAALQQVTVESVSSALSDWLLRRPLQILSMAMGNLGQSTALETVASVAKGLPFAHALLASASVSDTVHRVQRIVDPSQPIEVRKLNPREGDDNDAVVVSFIAGVATLESRVVLGLLGQILGQVAYNELRTNMQLGYVVNGGLVPLSNVHVISVIVQGNVLDAENTEAAIHKVYTKTMPQRLAQMTPEEFEMYKGSFVDSLLQAPFHIGDEVDHFWGPIASGSQCFRMHENMLKYITTSLTSKDLLIDAWRALVSPSEGVRKKISVKYFTGTKPLPSRPNEDEAAKIWAKQGLDEDAIALLRLEHQKALVLDKADSAARQDILAAPGSTYFPQDLHCDVAKLTSLSDLSQQPIKRRRQYMDAAGSVLAPDRS